MIQAPQLQYMPAQQPMQTNYQQGAYNPVQYSQNQPMPGTFYNYPTASSYLPTQTYGTDKSQYNGVNIEIINPQGQGVVPQQNTCQMPAQFVPVQQPVVIPQYAVPFPASQAIVQAPQAPQVPQAVHMFNEAPNVPAPQITSAPQTNVQSNTVNAAAPVVEQPVAQKTTVDPAAFAGKLKTTDLDAQKQAIEQIAEAVKYDTAEGPALLDTQVFDALVEVINKDTSALEAPTPEVIELRKKPQEQLTEEEKTKALTPTPLEKAEINKQYALYTISYMQERLNNELEKRNGKALELKDLPCIDQVIDAAKANPNPMIRIGALASLSHIARPEYKADLQTIFDLAKADEDTRVQEAATKAAESLNK